MTEQRPWPRDPRFLVGEDGTVVGPSGRVRRPHVGPRGYPLINAWLGDRARTIPVHVIVAESWHGPRPDGAEVAHGNGVRTDNRADNLRWATSRENKADQRLHGTNPAGERQGAARLSDETVRAIRAAYASGITQRVLAERFAVSQATVSDAVTSRTWSHLGSADAPDAAARRVVLGERSGRSKLTAAVVTEIRTKAAAGRPVSDIATRVGISTSAVRHVVARRTWRHVP